MINMKKMRRRKCQEWEGNNFKEVRLLILHNLIDILSKKRYVRIVKIKMLHQDFNVKIVSYHFNLWKWLIWMIKGWKLVSSIMKKSPIRFHYWFMRLKSVISKNKTLTHFIWSTTKFDQYSKTLMSYQNKT